MSYAQQQIIDLAPKLSDEAADAVVKVMNTFIVVESKSVQAAQNDKALAFEKLDRIVAGFTPVVDPDKELAEAREAKYGTPN